MKGLNIVVAEDDAIIKMYMEDLLNQAGHSVVGTATSGEDAVAQVGEFQPDIAVMDIGLKGALDGIEAALIMRNKFDIPVVFVSGNSDRFKDEARLSEIRPLATLVKPIDDRQLITLLAAFYEEREQNEE
jgi:CheY-like chemotaxis protein